MEQVLQNAAPEGFIARKLEKEDFNKGYISLLAHLTEVGEISEDLFNSRFHYISQHPDLYNIIVLEDAQTHALAASASLVVEHKFIRRCGKVGHIEDVVVSPDYRGRRLGTA